jgi:hypothetical protein
MCGPVPWETAIPETASGVYVVTLVDPKNVTLENLSALDRLRWNIDEEVIYIGRGKHLRRRVRQFYCHKHGNPSPHRGGQAIKLLVEPKQVYWAVAENYPDAEHELIEAFRGTVGALPFGNRMRAAQNIKAEKLILAPEC